MPYTDRLTSGSAAGFFAPARWRARWRRVVSVERLLVVQREVGTPLPRQADPPGEQFEFRRATPADLELWRAELAHKIPEYAERLKTPGISCTVGVSGDRALCQCWFAHEVFEDRPMGYTFRVGPRGVYLFDGWVSPAYRKQRLATAYLEWVYTSELPRLGYTHAVSYFAEGNVASQRMHEHFGFVKLRRLVRVRILGWAHVFERAL